MTVLTPKHFKAGERICQGRLVQTEHHQYLDDGYQLILRRENTGYKSQVSIEDLYKDSQTPDRKGGLGSSGV
jgi:dUTPase